MLTGLLTTMINKFKPDAEEKEESEGYNPFLLSSIQPQGGISFKEPYIRKGDGYEACIHVYDYPTILSDYWLENIMNMPNVVPTLDISYENSKDVITNINKSMAEQKTRGEKAKETADLIEASESYQELQETYNEIRQGEVIKRIIMRLYIRAETLDELEVTAKKVKDNLESLNYRGNIFLNEQEYEWDAMFKPFTAQQKYPNKRKGKEAPSLTLAGGYPFHFVSLDDPYGTHYGTTETGGNVIFDIFHKDEKRKSYNAVMVGKMGSGKSTLLKKVANDYGIKGHLIRIMDVTGEFEELANKMGGKVIPLDGSYGAINPLQVFKTVTDDDGNVNEEGSFTQHLSKLTAFYKFLSPDATNEELKEYENMLRKLYVAMDMWDDKRSDNEITHLAPEEYPLFENFLEHIQSELYEDIDKKKINETISDNRAERLENIELNIQNVVLNYGNLFNRPSSIADFDKEEFVTFPLRNVTALKPEIFQAQLFNVMNMLWDGMLSNGQPQMNAFDNNELAFEDARRYLILIDEAHHIINTRKGSEEAVKFLQKFMREARKYFGGLFYASHDISDFVPDNADQSAAEEVKTLFRLTQYKFIAEQDNESLNKLQNVFMGQLNESELDQIPYLRRGEVILSISSVKNIRMSVDVSDSEKALFGGGA